MSVLVNHPNFGSIWLKDAKIECGFVEGLVWSESSRWNMPDDFRGEYIAMNFPISCIRKIEKS